MADYWDIVTDEELTDTDLEKRYRQSLNDVYGKVRIAGIEFDTDYALEELDPIAFRVGLNDWIDAELGESITDVEPDRDEPWPYEAEEEAYQDLDL